MRFNCSLSVKSMKLGMMIVFKALKKIGYGAIAKKSVKCEKIRLLIMAAMTLKFSLKRLNFSSLDKKMSVNA